MKAKKKKYYNHSLTYFCHLCQARHNEEGGIGEAHIQYASPEVRKEVFLRKGIY